MSSKKPLISIVIPTLNAADKLDKLLSGLEKQTYKKFEVIVVDGYSHDGTDEVARKHGAKLLFLKKRSLSQARNLGIKNSSGSIIANIDADFELNKEFLEGLVECFEDKEVGGVKVREELQQDTLVERLDYMRTFYRHGGYSLAVRIFRRGMFYDEDITNFGEDMCMEKRIEGKIVYCKKSLIKHHRFHSFRAMARSWKVYCSCFVYYKKYEGSIGMIKGLIPLAFPIISPFIALHRLLTFKDYRALLIPIYDLVRTFAFIAGIPDYYFK